MTRTQQSDYFCRMFSGYSKNFWLMCVAMLLFISSFNLLLPELNNFITALGGAAQKGLTITIFTISAALSRPFSGKLSDIIGRKKVVNIGLIICLFVCLLYPLSTSVWFFLSLRFLHGFSIGFTPTGATALITDIVPENNRGRAMGIWGTFMSLGIGLGQISGSWIQARFGMDNLFLCSAFMAILSGIIVQYVSETLKKTESFKWSNLKLNKEDIVEPNVLPVGIVMFLTACSSGVVFVITPDVSEYLGLTNRGYFFGFYVLSTILIRLFTGSLSDKIGRRQTLLIGVMLLIVSMVLLSQSTTIFIYTLASVFFGIATGVCSPTLFAWTADLSQKHRRGVGAGTMFIALELGVMFGAFSTIFTYENTFLSISNVSMVAVILAMLALFYLLWHLKFRFSPH